jgi:hypothetical protein
MVAWTITKSLGNLMISMDGLKRVSKIGFILLFFKNLDKPNDEICLIKFMSL